MHRTSEGILSNFVPKMPEVPVTAGASNNSDNFTFSVIHFDRFECDGVKNKLTKFHIITSNILCS